MSFAVCLTFDFDALCVWLSSDIPATPARLSRGEYGARVGVPRILDLLRSYQIRSTFFVPGHSAESFPLCIEKILDDGHEIANHGYAHEDVSTQSPDDERRSLEKGQKILEKFIGTPPIGYRSPSWDYSSVTLPLLLEFGFQYDSSLFADDNHPYHPRLGDRVSAEEPLAPGRETDLWEFPVDFGLDDWPHFTFDFSRPRSGLSAPSKVLEIWKGDLDFMIKHENSGVFTLTMHPQVIGRGHRMMMLESFIQYVNSTGSAHFARMGDVASQLSTGINY
ncbi:MAG: polysaccharide deacetylase [Chloroflexi bacterium]|nr:polysaccharide deacetylase [Chloroflexota bacterium]